VSYQRRVTTWRELLAEARQGMPAREARWLVEEVSGWEGPEHALHLDDAVTQKGMVRFDKLLARRLAGEPIQYVLGHWPFRTLDLMLDQRVLIPRPETEGLVDHALHVLNGFDGPCIAVDLGTGSGAIALSLAAEHADVEVVASDVSADAIAVARANLAGLGGHPARRVRLVVGDWFGGLPEDLRGRVDLITANPPYVAGDDPLPDHVADWEPNVAIVAGTSGLESISRIVEEAPAWLAGGGSLVCEIGETQAAAARNLAKEAGFTKVTVFKDLARKDRYLSATLRSRLA
jgi:release factor glutamine methyltransferase